jgi:predicted Zn-dependent protease
MRTINRLSIAAALLAATACIFAGETYADSSGYPDTGRAIDQLDPASDYTDVLAGRQRAVSIMRARAQGFVPSPQLHDYVKGVLMRDLANVKLPASFQPEVRILAAPEFAALCTPDGTIIVTIGLLEQLENEDELAFVLGHEVSHAIYRHHDSDWLSRTQYYAVVNGAAVDDVSQQYSSVIGGGNAANIARGFDAGQHLYKLTANVLAPQMTRGQEDAADALGFDLMVKAGYNPEAALGLMDVLAEQEAEAAKASAQAKASDAASENAQSSPTSPAGSMLAGLGGLNVGGLNMGSLGIGGGGGNSSSGAWADFAISVFDKAIDAISDEATSHHPAKQREELLSAYAFREYRTLTPGSPTPLAWSNDSKSPLKAPLTALLAHYSAAEDAAGYIADASTSSEAKAQGAVQRSISSPTADHAYTEFVAAEFFEHRQPQLSEAALVKAVNGPEPSWEVYARLTDIYIARNDYARAQSLMASAAQRLDNSPVMLPKRIQILHALGDEQGAEKLLPECKTYDIRELYAECKKAAGKS